MHESRTNIPTCESFADRSYDVVLDDVLHDAEVLRCQGVLIHERVHRGEDVRRRRGR